jgi:HPt (histidine-containing phosphotransfer) domain-containing protein
MDRLLEFTDGSPENLRELVTLYLDQTRQQLGGLEAAVTAGEAAEVRRLAHSCAGASSTCGMRVLASTLRELELQASRQDLANAPGLCREVRTEFERVREFLEPRLAAQSELLSKG